MSILSASTTDPAAGFADTESASFEWRRWAALALLSGTSYEETIATMVGGGVPEAQAQAACGSLSEDPSYSAAAWMAHRLNKLESMLFMRQTMRDLSDVGSEIERRSGLARHEFLDEYYSANLPVILEDVCDDWPARERWTPDYLMAMLGDVEIEAMTDRESDSRFEINSNRHKQRMRFSEYVDRVVSTRSSNDCYVVANNHLLETDAATPLWDDIVVDSRYLDPHAGRSGVFLWFGPGGTVTPLHHDTSNVLFTQVAGRKRFILISPLETHCLYNDTAVYSEVDPLATSHEQFPRYPLARKFVVEVGPGDAVFIPVGWWHHVESLSLSLSVSFTNFVFPNQVDWFHPDIGR